MPEDLLHQLQKAGIRLQPLRAEAPISKRSGYIVTAYDAAVVTAAARQFGLQQVTEQDRIWQLAAEAAELRVQPKGVWAVSGRPPQLKLADGAQFEYLVVVVTDDGQVYWLAEYAYG